MILFKTYNRKIFIYIGILSIMQILTSYVYGQDAFVLHIEWKNSNIRGEIVANNGRISNVTALNGTIKGNSFNLPKTSKARLTVEVSDYNNELGPDPTVISVKTSDHSFSFFLRDITKQSPVFISDYNVVLLAHDDYRSFAEIENDILHRNILTKLQRIEKEEESSFETAAPVTRNMSVPVLLGIGRDMRLFEISEELEDMALEGKIIRPRYASRSVDLPDSENSAYIYALGRGVGPKNNITRKLDEGYIPIYHSDLKDDDVTYHTVSFVSFGEIPLTIAENRGTHYIISDRHSYGRSFTEEQTKEMEKRMEKAYDFKNNIILYSRTTIENTGKVPRYGWIKLPRPGTSWWQKKVHQYDEETGFSSYSQDRVFCISKFNDNNLQNEELAFLLQPGEKAEFDFFLPHTPISKDEAVALKKQSFEQKLNETRKYWKERRSTAARIRLPEKRIEDMLQAGLFHLDLITFGEEPNGALAPNVGSYSPIGTESAPIILYYLSMGWHDVAKRALNYFMETQRPNGHIQNYQNYESETGSVLWIIGEYMRYTNDTIWLKNNREKILKSCDYLISWRNKNKIDSLKGRGYGMIDGKVADPEDNYHQFMLNGYAYLGLSRIAEVLMGIDNNNADRLRKEAVEWKEDILETVNSLMAISPVVPLGDGRWVPTLPPWAEAIGPRALYQKKETFWSHSTFTVADAMLGPMYLVFCEIIDTKSLEAGMLLDYHSELFYQENSAFSQPYYSRHNWMQAKNKMAKPFLNTYYHTFSAHADRETFNFWEHMYKLSSHKTHEEAWFLMETRWMLYMEEGETLNLFNTIPRRWLEKGKSIELQGVKSYFGTLDASISADSQLDVFRVSVKCQGSSRPKNVKIRIPHPEYKKPIEIEGGIYNELTEVVTITPFEGEANIIVKY